MFGFVPELILMIEWITTFRPCLLINLSFPVIDEALLLLAQRWGTTIDTGQNIYFLPHPSCSMHSTSCA